MKVENTQAIIFAAGLGIRLKPFTNNKPKALAIVNGKTLLQRNIEYVKYFAITSIVINVHHFANQIIDFLKANNNFGCNIIISHEVPEVLETGGGLLFAAPHFTAQNILIVNCDILTNLNIYNLYTEHLSKNNLATLAITNRVSSRNLLFNSSNALVAWKNNLTGETKSAVHVTTTNAFAFSGIHIVKQELLTKITQRGKFSMIDVYLDLCKTEKIVGYEHSNDILIDVGKPESLILAEQLFQ